VHALEALLAVAAQRLLREAVLAAVVPVEAVPVQARRLHEVVDADLAISARPEQVHRAVERLVGVVGDRTRHGT
jgi:hypothetical protein